MPTFFIADDSPAKMMMLTAVVQKSGISSNVFTATSTEGAKQIIDKEQIDAAFIDYEMPSENGPAVIAHLRAAHPKAKIALVTSSNSEKYQQDGFAAGADAFVCTSLGEEQVRQTLEHLLEEWKAEIID